MPMTLFTATMQLNSMRIGEKLKRIIGAEKLTPN
jgi:hypothetical protein